MMDRTTTFLFSSALFFIGCAADPDPETTESTDEGLCPGEAVAYEPVKKGTQDFDLNLSLFLDLSDRIQVKKYPNPAMEYYQRDLGHINSLSHAFVRHSRAKQLRRMNERYQVFFHPLPDDPEINSVAGELRVHWTKDNVSKRDVCGLVNRFATASGRIYDRATQADKYVGSDIWSFFKDKVERDCIQSTARNILVIFTDGYMYHQQNKRKDGSNRWSFLLPKTVQELKLTGEDWEQVVSANDYGFIPAAEGLAELEVIVIGVRPSESNGPYEADVLKRFWSDWMTAMGVKRFEFLETDLPTNRDQWLQDYVLGLN